MAMEHMVDIVPLFSMKPLKDLDVVRILSLPHALLHYIVHSRRLHMLT